MSRRACLAAFSSAFVLVACQGTERVEDITLAELAARQHVHDGRMVRTRGTVRMFDSPRHYWLEDARINRVGLVPAELIAPHLGREVTVVGRYRFIADRGRLIEISSIEPFDETR